jgi:eukaryotic-like serine/threonine-protein kinase
VKSEERHSFSEGQRLGPYVIQSLFGVGGMGEVYRARDTRLGRDVAIKVLPRVFTEDHERLVRFGREARLLASLNHPNIATIHGLEESNGLQAIVMELVEGPTLASRIALGPMSFHEALPVARQVCEALEAAHEQGIIHRDLKPGNIKLRPDGVVKVLDFGLAKALGPASSVSEDPTTSPTINTHAMTGLGIILGTAAYMSPEQAKGRAADKRADIWAFGCVLFEMLTGRRAFEGDDISDTLAAVLRGEPDWRALGTSTPALVRRTLRRCLEKDRKQRLADISDVRLELDEALMTAPDAILSVGQIQPRRSQTSGVLLVGAAIASIAGVVTSAWLFTRPPQPVVSPERFTIPLGAIGQIAAGPSPVLAPSPDGKRLVYVAQLGGRTQLFLRQFDQFDSTAIAGTEGATAPFFSSDGASVGFFAGEAIQKVAIDGGAPLKISDVPSMQSASWGPDGTIVFATAFSGDGLWSVSANGGEPERLTKPDTETGEMHHVHPHFLPGGKSVLFTVVTADTPHPAVLSTGTRRWRVLSQIRMTSGGAQYIPTGHLLYAQAGGLVATAFNIDRDEITGASFPVREPIDTSPEAGAQFAVAAAGAGSLVYAPRATLAARTLMLVDREGRASPLRGGRAAYMQPRFSPSGHQLAVTIEAEGGIDVWVFDLERGTRTRLTAGGVSGSPAWEPRGKRVAFYAARPGPWTLYVRSADGSAAAEPLINTPRPERTASGSLTIDKLLPGSLPVLSGANAQYPMSWTRDGRTLAFTERKPSGERDIWILAQGSDPVPFLTTSFDESSPAFSPDGQFLAYVSDETGRQEVYVQPYPGPGGRWLISTAGGDDPVWSPNGRELFYRHGDAVMAVAVRTTPMFSVGAQREFLGSRYETLSAARNYDVSPDGQHFVMVQTEEPPSVPQFHLVLNWFGEFQRTDKQRH